MKTIAVFLCIVPLACIQATSFVETPEQIKAKSFKICLQEKKADEKKINEIFKKDHFPEDDPKFGDFFVCYWTQVKIIEETGSFNSFAIKIFYPYFIQKRFPKLTNEESQKLIIDAVQKCENVPKGNSLAVKAIQYRNCMAKYIIDKQH